MLKLTSFPSLHIISDTKKMSSRFTINNIFSGMWSHVGWKKVVSVSDEHNASICKVEEDIFFFAEGIDSIFPRNTDELLQDYTASHSTS